KAAMGISDEEPDIAPRNGFSGEEAKQDLRKTGPTQEQEQEQATTHDGEKGKAGATSSHEPATGKETPLQGGPADGTTPLPGATPSQGATASLFKLLDHGNAPYQFKEGESKSYFVKTQD
ncbi:hypothetical protein HAP94_25160, partial [Acidithiobacillus ferrivorans]|nr:hypothetical protein [Acidithiobacillus ferrivorans]